MVLSEQMILLQHIFDSFSVVDSFMMLAVIAML